MECQINVTQEKNVVSSATEWAFVNTNKEGNVGRGKKKDKAQRKG
jgi:hypothetical protein